MSAKQNGARMVSAANQQINGLTGHTVFMRAMVPTFVVRPLVKEALARGCAYCENEDIEEQQRLEEESNRGNVERHNAIVATITDVVVENDPKNFTATGMPNVAGIEAKLGYDIDASERDAAWVTWEEQNREAGIEPGDPTGAPKTGAADDGSIDDSGDSGEDLIS